MCFLSTLIFSSHETNMPNLHTVNPPNECHLSEISTNLHLIASNQRQTLSFSDWVLQMCHDLQFWHLRNAESHNKTWLTKCHATSNTVIFRWSTFKKWYCNMTFTFSNNFIMRLNCTRFWALSKIAFFRSRVRLSH